MSEYNEAVNRARRKQDSGSVDVMPRRENNDSNSDFDGKKKQASSEDSMPAIPGISDPKNNPNKSA